MFLLHPNLLDQPVLSWCRIRSFLLRGEASLAFTKQYQQETSGMMGLQRWKTAGGNTDTWQAINEIIKNRQKLNFIWECETCKMLKNTSKSCYIAKNAQGVLHPNVGHWLTRKRRKNINIKSHGMAGCNFFHPWEYFMWELYKYFNGSAQKSP